MLDHEIIDLQYRIIGRLNFCSQPMPALLRLGGECSAKITRKAIALLIKQKIIMKDNFNQYYVLRTVNFMNQRGWKKC